MIITFRYYNVIDVFIIGYSKGMKSISNISKSIQKFITWFYDRKFEKKNKHSRWSNITI